MAGRGRVRRRLVLACLGVIAVAAALLAVPSALAPLLSARLSAVVPPGSRTYIYASAGTSRRPEIAKEWPVDQLVEGPATGLLSSYNGFWLSGDHD